MRDPADHADIKITVATVVLNSEQFIEDTIRSVLSQDHGHIEFVVVDGGSTDGTLAIVERYRDRIDQLLVERDRGIYDAMNKAVRLATGDYLIFMNSGDEFATPHAVSDLCAGAADDEDFVYGGWIVRYPWGHERAVSPAPVVDFWRGMFVQHQSVMVKTRHLIDQPFDINAGLGADYAFLLDLIASGARYRQCDGVISRVSSDGTSDNNRIKVLQSQWAQARRHYPGPRTDAFYRSRIARERLARAVKSVLPASLVRRITQAK